MVKSSLSKRTRRKEKEKGEKKRNLRKRREKMWITINPMRMKH